jgi:hypothetical protein
MIKLGIIIVLFLLKIMENMMKIKNKYRFYKEAGNVKELFNVWNEIYQNDYATRCVSSQI